MVAQHNTPPSPNSQAYKDLPAVSISCVLFILLPLFLTYLFNCRSLVLATMKSVAPTAGRNSPTFDSQEFKAEHAKYVDAA